MWQRVPIWKISLIVVVILYSLWKLTPTLHFYSYDSYVRNSGITPEMQDLEKQIDQGAANAAALRQEYNDLRQVFRNIRNQSIRLGLDLQGGVHLVILVDRDKFKQDLINQGQSPEEIDLALETVLDTAQVKIESRVDQYGVAETALVKQPPDRLVLEMPGFNDPEEVKNLVRADAHLYFHLLAPETDLVNVLSDMDAVVEEDLGSLMYTAPGYGAVVVKDPDDVAAITQILARPSVKSVIPSEYTFKWGNLENASTYYTYPHRFLYLLKKKEELSGTNLQTAWVYINPTNNQPEVALRFDRQGARTFRRVTGDHIKEHLAIVLEDRVFSAPVIQDEIPNGSANINGIRDFTEARQISVVLRAGALPAPLTIAESRVVGPSLGADSIRSGLMAGLAGASIVLVFMVVYYTMTGIVADVAVMLNIFLLVAGMALFKATLTLPGIAGIVLTIGMAVDANVLIYERMREEMAGKRAKTIQLVLDRSFSRAFMTIFDSNVTTLITALVLFQFGTGPIKGFAVTLSLGIMISMFTAVFVSRVIMDTMVAAGVKDISPGHIRFFATPHYDFIGSYKACFLTSVLVGVIGFGWLLVNWEHLKGIDFAGGTEIVAQFQQPVSVENVRSAMGQFGLADTVIQQVLGQENQLLIRVREGAVADSAALENQLKTALPNAPF